MRKNKKMKISSEDEILSFELKFCTIKKDTSASPYIFYMKKKTPSWLRNAFFNCIIIDVYDNRSILGKLCYWYDQVYLSSISDDDKYDDPYKDLRFIQRLSIPYYEKYPDSPPIDYDTQFLNWVLKYLGIKGDYSGISVMMIDEPEII